MIRKRTLLQIRKYALIFFVLLLIFIYCNHYRTKSEDDNLESFPQQSTQLDHRIVPSPTKRRPRIYELAEMQSWGPHMRRIIFDEEETENLAPSQIISSSLQKHTTLKIEAAIPLLAPDESTSRAHKPKSYYVDSRRCKMHYPDPFSSEVLAIYRPSKFKSCSNLTDVINVEFDADHQQYRLHVDQKLVPKLVPGLTSYACYYRAVTRAPDENDSGFSEIHPRVYFQQDVLLPTNMSGIIVECHDVNNIDRIIQQDAFPLVQVRNQIDLKVNLSSSSPQSTPTIERQPSVILIGLDCMSRMNFQRTMPETAKFVKQQGWFEMQGYNKVTDGTLPNLLPILAGLKMGDLCSWRMPDCLDRQPWIWKAYKAAGYSTALADDVPSGGIFTTFSPGFLQVPVDHYLHTLLHGIAAFMKVYMRFGHSYCIGRRLSISYVFEFCTQFVQRYMEEHGRPVFGLFWTASFTHDHYYGASSLDAKFLEYMRVLEGHQLFEQAIVVLFSNQGARVGELVELSDGFLEERLPLLHIYLPAWFRNAYPKYAEALQLNRNRLCSNFDLHYTLQHILQLNAHEFFELPPLEKYPSSRSLLHPLPKDRSCEDAYIPEHWCTCNTFISVPKTGEMYLMAKVVVSHINGYLMKFYSNATCERLMLSDLEKCERKLIFEEDGRETMYGSIATFRLRFHTIPYGRFQATVFHNRETKFLERIHVPDVSRLSSYQNTSKCVQDKTAKKFCICRVYVPPQNQTTASRKVDKTAL